MGRAARTEAYGQARTRRPRAQRRNSGQLGARQAAAKRADKEEASCFLHPISPASYLLLPTSCFLLPDCYFPLPTSYFLLASSSMVWIGGHERRQCLCTCTCTCCCTCTCLCTCCCMHMPVYMYECMFTCCCTCTCLSIAQLMHESLLPCGMAARAGARACTQAGMGKHLCMRPGKRAARLYLHCRCCWLANDRRRAESLVVDSCVAQHDG